MRTLTLMLTLALGLTSALQARDSLSFQGPDVRLRGTTVTAGAGRLGANGASAPALSPPRCPRKELEGGAADVPGEQPGGVRGAPGGVSGKWFITAFVENKGLTGDRVFPITFSVLSDTHVWASMTHRDRGFCYDVDVVLEKTNVSGTYTASRGKTHVDVEELPAKDHLLFYCEGPFEGGMFRGAKLLSRNPDVSPEALEAFKKFAQRKGFSPEDVITPEQMESCEPASD
ncbi:vomeronasal secretory protein 1-like [Cervus canadensis]|uniref:vomeronasal secretory protein 1-like n=1 Tax=Cervus canadensis TaxID=1574408 RepID=UPI001C9E8F23|nr:vomeronasal secretory protein 1-like [Cervus canadensis]